jgi:hypothetical protein
VTRIRLTSAERQTLLDHYRRPADPEAQLRAHLLLLDAGHPWATTSAVLFCSLSTIRRWKGRFEAEGVNAVLGRPKGRRRSGDEPDRRELVLVGHAERLVRLSPDLLDGDGDHPQPVLVPLPS